MPLLRVLSTEEIRIFEAIRACLSPDLLSESERRKIRPGSHPVTGHCFIATHAAYHLIGQRHWLEPHWCTVEGGGTHWWLWNAVAGEYLDPTIEQAQQPFPYGTGRRCLLYTLGHKRTDRLLHLVRERLGDSH